MDVFCLIQHPNVGTTFLNFVLLTHNAHIVRLMEVQLYHRRIYVGDAGIGYGTVRTRATQKSRERGRLRATVKQPIT